MDRQKKIGFTLVSKTRHFNGGAESLRLPDSTGRKSTSLILNRGPFLDRQWLLLV